MTKSGDFTPHRYRSGDGRLGLFSRVYDPKPWGNDQPPLLMMHGLTRNSADFEPLIAQLESHGRLIVPDQRGRGQSEYDPEPFNYRPDIYAEDMWSLIDGLGVDRVICVGTSMGGLIAMVMAAQKSKRIAGIVLNDIGPEVSVQGLERISGYVGEFASLTDWDDAANSCQAINDEAFDGFGDDDWLAFAKRTVEQSADGQLRFAYDPAIARGVGPDDPSTVPPDLWAVWDAIAAIPKLIIRGAKSDILTDATAQKMVARHKAPISRVDIAGRGHAPLLDEPEAVNAVQAFLASQ